jgi:hypothetical protein
MSYTESDIGASAFLLAHGLKLLELEIIGPGPRFGFVFDDAKGWAAGLVLDYHDGRECPAKKLLDCLRELKNRLYAEKGLNRNGNGHKFY